MKSIKEKSMKYAITYFSLVSSSFLRNVVFLSSFSICITVVKGSQNGDFYYPRGSHPYILYWEALVLENLRPSSGSARRRPGTRGRARDTPPLAMGTCLKTYFSVCFAFFWGGRGVLIEVCNNVKNIEGSF